MQPVLTPAEMAVADAAAIAAGTSEATLVERAGGAVARCARRRLGGAYGRRVVVVCGKGNNGADGHVAARRLRAWGARVTLFSLGDLEYQRLGRALRSADLAVDAMCGTGLRGPLTGEAAAVADAFASAGVATLAVDIPSGVDGTTGAVDGPAVRATATACLAALKPGLLLPPGAGHAGAVEVWDIGIEVASHHRDLFVADLSDVARWLPRRSPESHKWSAGAVYVVAGSAGMTGAAHLTSGAALRAGAGMAVAGLPGDAAVRASGGEVITRTLPSTADGALDTPAVDEVLAGLERFGALVLGPGLGRSTATVAAVRRLTAEAPVPLVLDADGLNALDGDLGPLLARTAPAVCTPHAGEFERLAGKAPGPDRIGAARDLAQRSGAVILLKGSPTIVASPDGQAAVNTTGGPALATAGSGDVLSGIIGALVAQGMDVFTGAVAAAHIHGRTGAVAAAHGGPIVAGDLLGVLPVVLGEIGGYAGGVPPQVVFAVTEIHRMPG